MNDIETVIINVRGQRVILDCHLAAAYGVPTRVLNQAVKRNRDRFPEDFAFQLAEEEFSSLMSQSVTSKGRGGRRKLPYVFTEYGVLMAANVLRSSYAVKMSIFIVRAFSKMRKAFLERYEMEKRLDQIEKVLLVHDNSLRDLFDKIRPLLLPPSVPPKKQIGFGVKEKRARYAK